MINNRSQIIFSLFILFSGVLLSLCASAQTTDSGEDVAYYLPGLVSDKTLPMYVEKFSSLDGVKVKAYCLSSETLIVEIDRSRQKDDLAVEEAIRSTFGATKEMMPLTSFKKFNTETEMSKCSVGQMGSEVPVSDKRKAKPMPILPVK